MLDYKIPFTIAFGALMYAAVALRIPQLAGALASGNVSMSFQDVMGAASTASRTAATAGSAAATGVVGTGALGATGRLAVANTQQAGGGAFGAIKGGFQAAGTLANEAARATVPRLNRARENIAKKTSDDD